MTITGIFLDASDEPRAGTIVRFEPEDCPQPDGLGVITAPRISVTLGEDGEIPAPGVVLEQGRYLVFVGTLKRDVFQIVVLDSAATVDITTLMVTEPVEPADMIQVGLNFKIVNGVLMLKNKDTSLFHRIDLVGQPGQEQFEITIPGVS